jgi:CRP/FNR family transcriptional regulator, cyclic AMP receptor protein
VEPFFAFLNFLDEAERHLLSSLLNEKKILAGEVLFDYGDSAAVLYFLSQGRLAVHKLTGFEEKLQVIALLDPGSIVGETAILRDHVRHTRVVAIEDCRLYGLDRKDFAALKDQSEELACRFLEHILSIVALRLEKTSDRLARVL